VVVEAYFARSVSTRVNTSYVLGEKLVEQVIILPVEVGGLGAELLLFLVEELAVRAENVVGGP
jgi:hypothetical protein